MQNQGPQPPKVRDHVCCNSRLESKTKDILYREPYNQWMEAPDGANGVAITKQKKDVQVSCMLVP